MCQISTSTERKRVILTEFRTMMVPFNLITTSNLREGFFLVEKGGSEHVQHLLDSPHPTEKDLSRIYPSL